MHILHMCTAAADAEPWHKKLLQILKNQHEQAKYIFFLQKLATKANVLLFCYES